MGYGSSGKLTLATRTTRAASSLSTSVNSPRNVSLFALSSTMMFPEAAGASGLSCQKLIPFSSLPVASTREACARLQGSGLKFVSHSSVATLRSVR